MDAPTPALSSRAPARARAASRADWVARAATLVLPAFLLHGRSLADATLSVAAAAFVLGCALRGDWDWTRAPWVRIGAAWWAWLVLCSLPVPALGLGADGWGAFGQAVAMGRFILFAAALEHGVLRDPATRRWLWRVCAACLLYIAAHALAQFVTGFNLYGLPRGVDGELTGPFDKPRAGPVFTRLLLPVIAPALALLLARGRVGATLGATALLLAAVAMMVLIGQRMPLILGLFGLCIIALLLKRLRPLVAAALGVAVVLVGLSAVISPQAHHRLVDEFSEQMGRFGGSNYGHIYIRTAAIVAQHPVTGRGFDAFRIGCPDPRYWVATPDGLADGGGTRPCTTHPHNYYVQAASDAGLPGLALFAALAVAWIARAGAGLWRRPDPLRAGLFAAVFVQLWPIGADPSFATLPMSGWFFLLLGWALAEARSLRL